MELANFNGKMAHATAEITCLERDMDQANLYSTTADIITADGLKENNMGKGHCSAKMDRS